MKNIELNISALNASATSPGNFVMVLQEINSTRSLPITIGLQEAQTIAIALEKLQPERPLTHDLFLSTLSSLNASLKYVRISEIKNGIYISVIAVKDSNNNMIEIDSRTSDAIALAVRSKCSIYINENLLIEIAISESTENKSLSDKRTELDQYTKEELNVILSNLLKKEDYETASAVRDIISKKEQH